MLHPFYRIDGDFDILKEPVHNTHPALLLNIPHPEDPEKGLDLSRVGAMAERRVMRHKKVVGLFARVYGTAKVVVEIMKAYGVELDDFPGGFKFHIGRAEADMASESTAAMLQTIEDLYYALYARLNIEIANVQLCDDYLFGAREVAGPTKQSHISEQSYLSSILQACKEVLKSDEVGIFLNHEIIQQHQANYVRWAIEKSAREGYYPKDQVGYRQYILRLVANPESPAFLEWFGLNQEYEFAPAAALAALSEKYLKIQPKHHQGGKKQEAKRSASNTPKNDPETLERLRVLAHREAAGATLNGMTVGEFRRIEGALSLKEYAARMQCICFNFCVCARECTKKPARACPCGVRMSKICADQEIEPQESFKEKYQDLAEAIFEGLCVTSKGMTSVQMAGELKTGLDLFHQEVIDYRREFVKMSFR